MNILLFDMYASGHHVEYAGKLRSALSEVQSDITVDFLTTAPHDKQDEFFDNDEISYLFPTETDYFKKLDQKPRKARDRTIAAFSDYLDSANHDIAHVLQVDYCLRWLTHHLNSCSFDGAVVGSVNGSFFADQSLSNQAIASVLRSPLRRAAVFLAPDNPSRNLNLVRCLDSALDHVFVHSESAREHINEVTGSQSVTVVPDPLEVWGEELPDRIIAREQRSLPLDDPTLLYFGELREEKGVSLLLDALEVYEGPELTVVIAGSPADATKTEIDAVTRASSATVCTDLGYIPETVVPEYFAAADGVLIPYLSKFGSERTSGVFQKAAGAHRPVIVPRFGTFERRVESWDLGITFEPDSSEALAGAMSQFANNPTDCYESEQFDAYAQSQTYGRLADRIITSYQKIL